MVAEVIRFQAADGTLFDDRESATLHERNVANRKALVSWLACNVGTRFTHDQVTLLFHRLSDNADEVIELLKPYSVTENI